MVRFRSSESNEYLYKSVLASPIIIEGESRGSIVLERTSEQSFSALDLNDLELVTGTTPSFVNMANATASSATGQSLYVNDAGTTTTLAPANSWTATTDGTNEVLKATYAYGSFTVGYSQSENDLDSTGVDVTMTSMAATYSVTDELSVTYGIEESETSTASDQDAELSAISFAYTAGGMTLSGKMTEGENLNYTTASGEDMDAWTLGASFAF